MRKPNNYIYIDTMNLDAPISSIMTTNVEAISPDQKLVAIKHIYESPQFHSHIPVTKNDKIVGIVSLINFMRAIQSASLDDNESVYQEKTAKDIMTLNPSFVTPETSIRKVVTALAKGDFHSILIATSEKELKGIVTTTDILRQLLKE